MGGSRRATAAGERWNPETQLQPHGRAPPRQGLPHLCPYAGIPAPQELGRPGVTGTRRHGDTGPAVVVLQEAHTCTRPLCPHRPSSSPGGASGRDLHGTKAAVPGLPGCRAQLVPLWPGVTRTARSVGCGLGAPCLPPHPQHTPELPLRADQDRLGMLHQSRDSEWHGDVLTKGMEIPQQRPHPVMGEQPSPGRVGLGQQPLLCHQHIPPHAAPAHNPSPAGTEPLLETPWLGRGRALCHKSGQ